LKNKKLTQNSLENDRMSILWREREHEEVDRAVFDNDEAKQALHACGMYKFFQVGGMRAQRRLLNLLIDYWNPDVEAFMLVQTVFDHHGRRYLLHYQAYRGEGKYQTSNLREEARVSMILSMSIAFWHQEEWLASAN
jgi:hypothetical protein